MNVTGKSIVLERMVPGLKSGELERFVTRACHACGLRGHISVLLTGDSQIRRLNARFRGKNSATDVLSFPPRESNGLAGDIAISLDIAAENARSIGHSVADEVRILILHGILHLAGYDHENDQGEMEKRETALRKKFGLTTGLIERNSMHARNNSSPVAGRESSAKTRRSSSSRKRATADAGRSRI